MTKNDPVIVSAVRTPVGKFGGSLRGVKVADLGKIVVKESPNTASLVARMSIHMDQESHLVTRLERQEPEW